MNRNDLTRNISTILLEYGGDDTMLARDAMARINKELDKFLNNLATDILMELTEP